MKTFKRSLFVLTLVAVCEVLALYFLSSPVAHENRQHAMLIALLGVPLVVGGLVVLLTVERKNEAALRESEAKYRDLVDSLPQPVYEVDDQGQLIFCNHAAFGLFGYSQEDLARGLNVLQTLTPGDRGRALLDNQRVLSGEDLGGTEYMALAKDGRAFPVIVFSRSFRQRGKPAGLRGIMVDITERRRAEDELLESRRRLSLRSQIAGAFLTSSNGEVYGKVLEIILKALASKQGVFGHIDEVGDLLCSLLNRDVGSQGQISENRLVLPRKSWTKNLLGRALAEKKVLVREGPLETVQGQSDIQRAMAVPITFREEVIGLLMVENKETAYSEADQVLLENIGNAIAPILQARLARYRAEEERRKAVAALTDSETRYRRLFEAAQDGILILDPETGHIHDVNPFLTGILGYSKEELLGKALWEVGAFKDIQANQEAFRELQAEGYIRYEDLPLRTRDGRMIDVEFVSNLYPVDGKKVIQCNIREITERKRAVEALRESELKFRSLVERLNVGVYRNTGPGGQFLEANPALLRIFGYTDREEFMNTPVADLYQDPEDRRRYSDRLDRKGFVPNEVLRLKKKDKTPLWCSVTATAVYGDQGKVLYYEGIIEDITEQKLMIDRLRHLASHDPLTNLPNRDLFYDRLNQLLAHGRRYQRKVAVMMLDLDNFKGVNDTLGHARGDEVLKTMAERLERFGRKGDTVARQGGDEFMFVFEGVSDQATCETLARKILETISSPIILGERTFLITGSIGICLHPDHGEDVETLVRNVDKAMYRAKETRNCYRLYAETEPHGGETREEEAEEREPAEAMSFNEE